MIKSFEEYQVDNEQLFEAKAAFNAAVQMCKEHYGNPFGVSSCSGGLNIIEKDPNPELQQEIEELRQKNKDLHASLVAVLEDRKEEDAEVPF